MLFDFIDSLKCIRNDEIDDYHCIINEWQKKNYHVALMPSITWYPGICNLFDQKAGAEGKDMIWIIPAGQAGFYWLPTLKQKIEDFYDNDEIYIGTESPFPGVEAESFEECILLSSNDLPDDTSKTILGANVILVRFSLSGGRESLLFILLDHQDNCWKNIIEKYKISLTWFVDSGRGTGDYYVRINLYQLMKNTALPELLPALYFKGIYNKGEIPDGFLYRYSLLSKPDRSGYDIWQTFSAVYDTGWKKCPE